MILCCKYCMKTEYFIVLFLNINNSAIKVSATVVSAAVYGLKGQRRSNNCIVTLISFCLISEVTCIF